MNEKSQSRPGVRAHHEKKRNTKDCGVLNKGKLFFSPELARPGDNMICLKTEPAELQGDWKPRRQREEHKPKARCPAEPQNSPARRTGRRTMGQATRNPETQERTVRCWALELSSQREVASYLLLDKDDKHRVSNIYFSLLLGGGKGPCCRGKADSPPPNTAFPCGHIGSYFSSCIVSR